MQDTIAAIATGGGISAIGIVRISGDDAIVAAGKIFRPASGISITEAKDRQMYYGELLDTEGATIDLCLCAISRSPASYTGEDTVEFHCHGSPVVLAETLAALFRNGVRQATAGEFTKRAFLNGRMDLTQAEAVIDLIESETTAAARNAAGQLRGAIGAELESVYSMLLDIMAHFHAYIDYPDEDIDDFEMHTHLQALIEAREKLLKMLSTHSRGRVLRDGIPTAIIGRPNTGKSSLLNVLLGYERAIVTDTPGTTRDTVEEKALLGGLLLRLIDTAGIRKTEERVERLGVMRTLDAVEHSGLVLLVLDGSEPLCEEDYDALRSIPDSIPKIAVVNKSDLPHILDDVALSALGIDYCRVCALTGDGFESLEREIKKAFPSHASPLEGEIITNARQAEAISNAADCVNSAVDAISVSVTPDAVLTEVEAALSAIGDITGKNMKEDIIARIFERFCVGK